MILMACLMQCPITVPHGIYMGCLFRGRSHSTRPLSMPKNPNKRKINPGKVTHVTWVTKDTTRGPSTRLVRFPAEKSQKSKHETAEPSPSQVGGSGSQSFIDGMQQSFDDSYMDFEDMKPTGLPHKKVWILGLVDIN